MNQPQANLEHDSLPLEVPKRFRDILDIVTAYDICLRLEKSLQLAINKGDDVGNKLITFESLAILYTTCRQIKDRKTSSKKLPRASMILLFLMSGKYIMIIRSGPVRFCFQIFRSACNLDLTRSPVRANKGRISTPSSYKYPVSFDTITKMAIHALVDPQSLMPKRMSVLPSLSMKS